MIVVFLYDYPYVEISLLLIGEMFTIFVIFKYSLFKSKWMNIFVRFSEVMFFLALILVLAMQIYSDQYLNQSGELPQDFVYNITALGWLLIAFVLSIIGFFLCILNWNLLKGIGKLVKHFKNIYEMRKKKQGNAEKVLQNSPHNEEDVSDESNQGISKIM